MRKKYKFLGKSINILLINVSVMALILLPAFAQFNTYSVSVLNLPVPGSMIPLSKPFDPVTVRGVSVYPDNALQFDFYVDAAQSTKRGQALKNEADKLLKYFFAALTVPEKEMWVNLSPKAHQNIIPTGFGQTIMGRDLLAQDYILKQLTASLLYPESESGKSFWEKVHSKTREQLDLEVIPQDALNRIWIVPQKAVVFESGYSAFVVESQLKVMLEVDYLEMIHGEKPDKKQTDEVVERAIRDIILPEIENEINQGETFSNLRQIYQSMILATWYKLKIKESLLSKIYVDKNKPKGVDVDDPKISQKIYDQYMDAFKKGVYNIVKEDYDPTEKQMIPRKYFSGGAQGLESKNLEVITDEAMLSETQRTGLAGEGDRFYKLFVEAVENPSTILIEQANTADPAFLVVLDDDFPIDDAAAAIEVSSRIVTPQGSGEVIKVYKGGFLWAITYIDILLDDGERLLRVDLDSLSEDAATIDELKASLDVTDDSEDSVLLDQERTKRVGGINLDATLLDMQIKRDARGVALSVNVQPLENMDIEGFLPVILNMIPIAQLPVSLSYNKNDPQNIKYSSPSGL